MAPIAADATLKCGVCRISVGGYLKVRQTDFGSYQKMQVLRLEEKCLCQACSPAGEPVADHPGSDVETRLERDSR